MLVKEEREFELIAPLKKSSFMNEPSLDSATLPPSGANPHCAHDVTLSSAYKTHARESHASLADLGLNGSH